MADIKKLLGKKIKQYRENKNYTQEQLAEMIGINSRSLSLIERGSNFVTSETLEKISCALDIFPKQLFDFDEEFSSNFNTKEKLLKLIEKNEDKITTIYKLLKGFIG